MKDLKQALKVYSSGYNDATALRATVSAIPYLGSQLDLFLSTPGQKFMEERIMYLIDELQTQMNEVHENAIDKRLFETEEGFDLVNSAFTIAAKTRQREKIKIVAQILRGAFTKKSTDHHAELYLSIVNELSARELEIAFLLHEIKSKRKTDSNGEIDKKERDGMSNDPYWISKNYPKYTKDELQFILPRLEKTGLVKELVGSFLGYGGGSYNPTPLFKGFISFIKDNE